MTVHSKDNQTNGTSSCSLYPGMRCFFWTCCCAHHDDCGSLCNFRHRDIGRLRGLVTRLACRCNTNNNKHQTNKPNKNHQQTRRRISRKQWRQLNKDYVWCECGHHKNTTTKIPPHHHKNTPPHPFYHSFPPYSGSVRSKTSILPQFSTVVRFSPVKNINFTSLFHCSPV